MPKSPFLKFPPFAPDISDLDTDVSQNISGVVPRGDGYGPFKSLQAFTQALPDNCRGFFFARRSDGSIAAFAGTATDLYILNNTDFSWSNVSKGAVPYATLVPTENWEFRQFNDLVIAVQTNTVPQVYTLSSSSAFGDLGGMPPQAAHIAIINRFVVLTGLLSNPQRVQWSDLDNPTEWTAGVGLSDFQDQPDGGLCHGISGGDYYGVLFQDESIRTMTYAPGSAVTFQFARISTQDTLFAQYSVINIGDQTFFISAQGFKLIAPGAAPVAIGKERVDRYFFANVDTGNLQLVIGASDPGATRVYWAFKSLAGSAGLFDTVLCYDWSIGDQGSWSVLFLSGEYLASLAKPGLTLENMDAIAPTQLSVLGAADNGSGAVRLTLNAVSNANFAIAGQNFIVVQGVVGTIEANGSWKVTIVDSTHIDLMGSVFVNAYVSGGKIGGSLDALPFSLDSVSTAALTELAAFDGNNQMGFFAGPTIEAVLETAMQDADGDLFFISGVRPMTDCPDVLVSIGGILNAQSAVTYSAETEIDARGFAPQLVETRYPRAKCRFPAGSAWKYARGVQPEAQLAGDS